MSLIFLLLLSWCGWNLYLFNCPCSMVLHFLKLFLKNTLYIFKEKKKKTLLIRSCLTPYFLTHTHTHTHKFPSFFKKHFFQHSLKDSFHFKATLITSLWLCFYCRRHGSIPDQETKILYTWHGPKKWKINKASKLLWLGE